MTSQTTSGARRGPNTTGDEYTPDPRRWKALIVCLVAGFMTLLDVSIVNVALPSIETGLGAGENALQWIVSGYALTFGLLLVPAGRVGDARGRRSVFLAGVVVFLLASAGCGFAPNGAVLVAARLLQGCGGALITPQVSGFIQTLFRGQERGKAFGFFGATVGLSTAVGPLLGGAIISLFGADLGWRMVFFVNLPVGALAIVLALRYLPAPPRREPGTRSADLDPIGVVLLGIAVLAVLLPFIEQRSWPLWLRLTLFPVAAGVLLLWVSHERRYGRTKEPVVSLDLFRIRSYVLGAAVGLAYFAGFTGVFFIYTQYLQSGLGYSALQAGLATTPFAVGGALTSIVGSRKVLALGRGLIAAGLATVIVGLAATWVAVLLVPGPTVGWAAAVPLLVAGLGGGLVISPNQTLSLSQVPVTRAGSAGGVLQTGQRIGSAAGIAATGSVFYSAVASTRGDFATAFRYGLFVIIGFVAVALVLALADSLTSTKKQAPKPHEPTERVAGATEERDAAPTGRHAAGQHPNGYHPAVPDAAHGRHAAGHHAAGGSSTA